MAKYRGMKLSLMELKGEPGKPSDLYLLFDKKLYSKPLQLLPFSCNGINYYLCETLDEPARRMIISVNEVETITLEVDYSILRDVSIKEETVTIDLNESRGAWGFDGESGASYRIDSILGVDNDNYCQAVLGTAKNGTEQEIYIITTKRSGNKEVKGLHAITTKEHGTLTADELSEVLECEFLDLRIDGNTVQMKRSVNGQVWTESIDYSALRVTKDQGGSQLIHLYPTQKK